MKRKQLNLSDIRFMRDLSSDNLNHYYSGKRTNSSMLSSIPLDGITYTNDIIESNFFVQGVVLAHFILPTTPSFSPDSWRSYDSVSLVSDAAGSPIERMENAYNFSWNSTSDLSDISELTARYTPEQLQNRLLPPNIQGLWGGIQYGSIYRDWYIDTNADYLVKFGKLTESGDILFIRDTHPKSNGACVAVVGTQHYGNSFSDRRTPINVDSAYIPARYHISVGDIVEIYSGHIVEQRIDQPDPSGRVFPFKGLPIIKHFIDLGNNPLYTVTSNTTYRPVFSYTEGTNALELDEQDALDSTKQINLVDNLPKPRNVSILRLQLLGPGPSEYEGALVRIRDLRFDPKIFSTVDSDFINLEPNRIYQLSDDFGNTINMRICNGTEMAIHMPKMNIKNSFDLVGIVAGHTTESKYEIWPRTMYDLGLSSAYDAISSRSFLKGIDTISLE